MYHIDDEVSYSISIVNNLTIITTYARPMKRLARPTVFTLAPITKAMAQAQNVVVIRLRVKIKNGTTSGRKPVKIVHILKDYHYIYEK